MESIKVAFGIIIFLAIFVLGIGATALVDIYTNEDLCDEYGAGYSFAPRPYFIGDKKCVFSQEEYDREVNTIVLE